MRTALLLAALAVGCGNKSDAPPAPSAAPAAPPAPPAPKPLPPLPAGYALKAADWTNGGHEKLVGTAAQRHMADFPVHPDTREVEVALTKVDATPTGVTCNLQIEVRSGDALYAFARGGATVAGTSPGALDDCVDGVIVSMFAQQIRPAMVAH